MLVAWYQAALYALGGKKWLKPLKSAVDGTDFWPMKGQAELHHWLDRGLVTGPNWK